MIPCPVPRTEALSTAGEMNGDWMLPRTYARDWAMYSAAGELCRCPFRGRSSGKGSGKMAGLFWWMTVGAAVVWLGVMALRMFAIRARPDVDHRPQAHHLILAGAITPTIVLCGLLLYGLSILIAPAPKGSLGVSVYGEQCWWRVRYEPPGRQLFDLANEVRMS